VLEVSSNGYFFFFLAVFFAFFAFFAFLAMLPSVIPKVGSMQVDIDMHAFRVHHNCKIDTARFEEGKRPSRRRNLRPDEALESAWPPAPEVRQTLKRCCIVQTI
jgi:hypothetical protein